MKNCPTCGQPLLPSMGEIKARKVVAQVNDNPFTISVQIGDTVVQLKGERTPRGVKAQHVIKRGKRYRLRFNFVHFPRKGTLGGKLRVIQLGGQVGVMVYELPEVVTTFPEVSFLVEFGVDVSFGEEGVIPVSARLSSS